MPPINLQIYFSNSLSIVRVQYYVLDNSYLMHAKYALCIIWDNTRVMRVGSDTFGDPFIQTVLQS